MKLPMRGTAAKSSQGTFFGIYVQINLFNKNSDVKAMVFIPKPHAVLFFLNCINPLSNFILF